jgi:hypothetical protein
MKITTISELIKFCHSEKFDIIKLINAKEKFLSGKEFFESRSACTFEVEIKRSPIYPKEIYWFNSIVYEPFDYVKFENGKADVPAPIYDYMKSLPIYKNNG